MMYYNIGIGKIYGWSTIAVLFILSIYPIYSVKMNNQNKLSQA